MLRPLLSVSALALLAVPSLAQCFEWGTEFRSPGGGVNNTVRASAVFDDGSGPALYLAGDFTSAAIDVAANHIVRWDGTAFSTVGVGLDASVKELCVFDDGSGPALYATGEFTTAGGAPMAHIARWDGSSWSPLGTGIDGTGYALTVFDDGNGAALYAGGSFSIAGGVFASRIARWDGGAWSALGLGTNNDVYALVAHDDGSGPALYAGGIFTQAGGNSAMRIARWDGGVWSALGLGISGPVHALATYAVGATPTGLIIGGSFGFAGGGTVHNLAHWNGSSFSPFGAGADSTVFELHSQGGVLYLGGNFSHLDTVTAVNLGRYDGTFASVGGAPGTTVFELALYDSGSGPELYAGGVFLNMDGRPATRIARRTGTTWLPLAPGLGLSGNVTAIATYDDGNGPSLFVAGTYDYAGLTPVDVVARWTGSSWVPLPGGPACCNPYVLYGHDDGNGRALYMGGDFGVWRWKSGAWSNVGAALGGGAFELVTFDDGSGPALYAAGYFPGGVVRWDGTTWSVVGGGLDNDVVGLCVHDDGTGPALYAAGAFLHAGGAPVTRAAKWDGTSWTALGTGFNNTAFTLESFDDGTGPALYAGGIFTTAGGNPAVRIARWKGGAWSGLGWTPGEPHDFLVYDDGTGAALYVAGNGPLTRWNAAGPSAVGVGAPGPNETLAIFDDGRGSGPDLYVGGIFVDAGGRDSWRLARWHGCPGAGTLACFGDGVVAACPCANNGLVGRGCNNSASTGGAQLSSTGATNPDTVVLTAQGETASAVSIVLQGDATSAPVAFGDGLRCTAGALKRLYVKTASGGVVVAPQPGDLALRAQSAALGDTIPPGGMRSYAVYYRDGVPGFCPAPTGSTFNVSNALRIVWP